VKSATNRGVCLVLVLLAPGCSSGTTPPGPVSLHQQYADYFPIGAAVNSTTYTTHAKVLTTHFNSITCENEMKFYALEPVEGQFTYDAADTLVDFAVSHGMKVRGHTLVWHRQTPSWLFVDSTGAQVSSDVLLARMRNHIANVVGHYKGKVYAWDVVNEAILDSGAYRTGDTPGTDQQSLWYAVIGPGYIAEAFKAAHEADPDAKLFYNDFHNYVPIKQQAIYIMLRGLIEAGVPIHGVGLQGHLNIEPSTDSTSQGYYQTVPDMEQAIRLYTSLGLSAQVTEMDMSLYVPGVAYTSSTYYTAATFTDALQAEQAQRYGEFFAMFRSHRDVITGVTTWGIADDATWLSQLAPGKLDFPLLFDVDQKPKKAFDAVVDF
jgi:endo-1,4-beta-xylanase